MGNVPPLAQVLGDLHGAPGCAYGVAGRGDRVAGGIGLADVDHRIPATSHVVFDIASTSKQMTAAAVLGLVDDGRLELDAEITAFVDGPAAWGRITVRHLIEQSSGLVDYMQPLLAEGRSFSGRLSHAEGVAAARRAGDPQRAPGLRFEYSNTNYLLLASIVEAVTGEPFDAYLAEHVFRPLGMGSTSVHVDPDGRPPGHARGYRIGRDGAIHLHESHWTTYGDGDVQSCVDDLLAWGRAVLDGGPADSHLREWQRHGQIVVGDDGRIADRSHSSLYQSYGAGLFFGSIDAISTICHPGDWVGFTSQVLMAPDSGLVVAVLSNGSGRFDVVDASVRMLRWAIDEGLR